MTQHFNELTEAESERLVILIEECGEVIQAGCKILRHGYSSTNPTVTSSETNRGGLERELGDLLHALNRMEVTGDVDRYQINKQAQSKARKITASLHHQVAEGSL